MLPQMHLFSPDIQKFVLAVECLMFHDVTPHSLTETDLEAIRYYVQCLSDKFAPSAVRNIRANDFQAHASPFQSSLL
jgi:hypothetical protein